MDNPEGSMDGIAIPPCVAPALQSPSKPGPSRSGSKIDTAHMHANSIPGRVRSPLSNTKAPRPPTSRSNLAPPGETVGSTSRQRTVAPTPSSPGPSRQSGRPTMHASKSEGFTQFKHQLGTSVSDVSDQVAGLRSRIQILKDDVREFAPHLYQRAFENADIRAGSYPQDNQQPLGNGNKMDRKGKGVVRSPSSPM
ncbi:uncharacterized protein FOMMEDRAFT_23710, partial [Fomitiporia mediterranea MF3/22]|uniref:uncharacterized protein n=1 Tax=Fomitiporia mediterranea (strain MF3/22) TaxID=694068 RepID=UPI0004408F53